MSCSSHWLFSRARDGLTGEPANTDVIGAQQAITTLLSQSLSTILTLCLVLAALFALSWQISILALIVIPLFVAPARIVGPRLQRLARQQMQLDAELGSMMNERFNVAGAILTKLYGRPDEDLATFDGKAGRVRDLAVMTNFVWQNAPARARPACRIDDRTDIWCGRQPRHQRHD